LGLKQEKQELWLSFHLDEDTRSYASIVLLPLMMIKEKTARRYQEIEKRKTKYADFSKEEL